MVTIRKARLEDFDFFYGLKCEETNVFWTGHGEKPDRDNLHLFFSKAVESADSKTARKIYIIEDGEVKVGHLYIVPDGEDIFDLASAVSMEHQGKGYAKKAIVLGLEEGKRIGYKKMVGSIREDNIASMKAYAACGVTVTEEYKMVYIPKLDKEIKMYIVEKEL